MNNILVTNSFCEADNPWFNPNYPFYPCSIVLEQLTKTIHTTKQINAPTYASISNIFNRQICLSPICNLVGGYQTTPFVAVKLHAAGKVLYTFAL